jgi:hypothetical protein
VTAEPGVGKREVRKVAVRKVATDSDNRWREP